VLLIKKAAPKGAAFFVFTDRLKYRKKSYYENIAQNPQSLDGAGPPVRM
jgi:hypothetical protein